MQSNQENNSFQNDTNMDNPLFDTVQKIRQISRSFQNYHSAIEQGKQNKKHIRKEYLLNEKDADYDSKKKIGNAVAIASSSGITTNSFNDIFDDQASSHANEKARLRLNAENEIRSLSRKIRQNRRNQQYELTDGFFDLF